MTVDDMIQKASDGLKKVIWREYEDNPDYVWYYAEDRLYVIRNKNNQYAFIKAGSPQQALNKMLE